ncbi:hypothetical protein GE061_007967 [Apolygus lucorum]|uniref:Uncharacterized protein n=1 Tax=Apolygus lucorum TaxID=248454 RepID=A0A6A4IV79_APOLU|nr:hypothetical protein GE061_007967 [Apolygus lucorum]
MSLSADGNVRNSNQSWFSSKDMTDSSVSQGPFSLLKAAQRADPYDINEEADQLAQEILDDLDGGFRTKPTSTTTSTTTTTTTTTTTRPTTTIITNKPKQECCSKLINVLEKLLDKDYVNRNLDKVVKPLTDSLSSALKRLGKRYLNPSTLQHIIKCFVCSGYSQQDQMKILFVQQSALNKNIQYPSNNIDMYSWSIDYVETPWVYAFQKNLKSNGMWQPGAWSF